MAPDGRLGQIGIAVGKLAEPVEQGHSDALRFLVIAHAEVLQGDDALWLYLLGDGTHAAVLLLVYGCLFRHDVLHAERLRLPHSLEVYV